MEISTQYKSEMNSAIDALLKTLEQNPEIWSIRKEAARLLFDNARYKEAAEIVWTSPEIPAIDLEIAFAARVVSRAQPQRAIRLLNHVLEKAISNPAKLLALANALMHYGMVLQAARFYGAATACDHDLVNADLEHFMLWLDDSHRLWGEWEKDEQLMEELPWVKRDEKGNEDYEKMMSGLTTPIKVPGLKEATAEHLVNEYYRQIPIKGAEITAPPAVTVPLDQLNPDDVIHNDAIGASITKKKKAMKAPQSIVPDSGKSRPATPPPPTTGPTPQADLPKLPIPEAVPPNPIKPSTGDGKSPMPRLIVDEADPEVKKPKFLF